MGYPSVLTANSWGFYDVLFKGNAFKLQRPYGSYVMENVLFKIAFPAEFHAQTAVECALLLHQDVKDRLNEIKKIELTTQESALRIIDKKGPLYNPADRDHCLQYIVAIALMHGTLTAEHYEDQVAKDARIDALRDKMETIEDQRYSRDYLDPEKRSIANAVQVFFWTEQKPTKSRWNIRSATAGVAKTVFRCCWRNSKPISRAVFRRNSRRALLRSVPKLNNCKRRRSMSLWIYS